MKDPTERTKVVIRHLPPSISPAALMEQIDGRFSGRYYWTCFRPGKHSHKNQKHSRAYINFKRPEDVVEFAEFFDGHIFVNEKGAQFKALVEYAPSQHVPKLWSKKDGREGTISKDPEYMEFLELISKPVEHLPSAEIQLERKEAERSGAAKETLIVTPLMEFVRQKRAVKSGTQRTTVGGKSTRRVPGASASSSSPSRRSSERRRGSNRMYVLKESSTIEILKDKPKYLLMPKKDVQHASAEKSVSVASASGKETLEDEFASGVIESGKSRLVLLKGKEKEGSDASGGLLQQQTVTSSARSSKQNQRLEASGKIIRSILTKEGRTSQSQMSSSHPDQQTQIGNVDKRPPRSSARSILKDQISSGSLVAPVSDSDDKKYLDDKVSLNSTYGSMSISEKHDKRIRNKDRPDRGVWAPLRRADKSQFGSGMLSSSEPTRVLAESLESVSISQLAACKVGEDNTVGACVGRSPANEVPLGHSGRKTDMQCANKSEDMRSSVGGRISLSSVENGSLRQVGRRGTARGAKEMDSSLGILDGKMAKRGSTGYGSHERQVWVQKSSSAS